MEAAGKLLFFWLPQSLTFFLPINASDATTIKEKPAYASATRVRVPE